MENAITLKRAGPPKKAFDGGQLDAVLTVAPESPGDALAQLFVLDARMLDRQTQHELLRILPQLVHARRAWKAHFLEHGCLLCKAGRKPDPTNKIAANLRRMGMTWPEIFKALTIDAELTARDRKLIRTSVSNSLRRRARGLRRRIECKSKESTWYGSGGLCSDCQHVVLFRMLQRFRRVTKGRNTQAETAALIDALALRYNAAQRLFNEGDEEQRLSDPRG